MKILKLLFFYSAFTILSNINAGIINTTLEYCNEAQYDHAYVWAGTPDEKTTYFPETRMEKGDIKSFYAEEPFVVMVSHHDLIWTTAVDETNSYTWFKPGKYYIIELCTDGEFDPTPALAKDMCKGPLCSDSDVKKKTASKSSKKNTSTITGDDKIKSSDKTPATVKTSSKNSKQHTTNKTGLKYTLESSL